MRAAVRSTRASLSLTVRALANTGPGRVSTEFLTSTAGERCGKWKKRSLSQRITPTAPMPLRPRKRRFCTVQTQTPQQQQPQQTQNQQVSPRGEHLKEIMSILDRWFPNKDVGKGPKAVQQARVKRNREERLAKKGIAVEKFLVWKRLVALHQKAKDLKQLLETEQRDPTPEESELLQRVKSMQEASEQNLVLAEQRRKQMRQIVDRLLADRKIHFKTTTGTFEVLAMLTQTQQQAVAMVERCKKAVVNNRHKAIKTNAHPIRLLQTQGDKQGWLYCASSAHQFYQEFRVPRNVVSHLCKHGWVEVKGQRCDSIGGFVVPDEAAIKACEEQGKVVRVRRAWDMEEGEHEENMAGAEEKEVLRTDG